MAKAISWNTDQNSLTIFYGVLAFFLIPLLIFTIPKIRKNLDAETKRWWLVATSLAFTIWAIFYGVTAIAHYYPITDDELEKNRYAEQDRNFIYAFYGISIGFIGLCFPLLVIFSQAKLLPYSWTENLYLTFIFMTISYAVIGCIYYLDLSAREGRYFPLTTSSVDNDNFNQEIYNTVRIYTYPIFGILCLIGLINFLYHFLKKRALKYPRLTIASIVLFIFWVIIYEIIGIVGKDLNEGNKIDDEKKNYTFLLIILTFLILLCLGLSIIIINFNSFDNEREKLSIGGILSLFSLLTTAALVALIYQQSVTFDVDSDVTLLDGQKIHDYNESDYNYLNYSMTSAYIVLAIISLILFITYIFAGKEWFKWLKNISDFFTLKIKWEEVGKYLPAIINTVLLGLLLLIPLLLGFSLGLGKKINEKGAFDKPDNDDNFLNNPAKQTTFSLEIGIILLGIIELINNGLINFDDPSYLISKLYQILSIFIIMILPIVSLIFYYTSTPTFYVKIDNDHTEEIVLGNTSKDNAIASIDNYDDTDNFSQFSVESNFSYFGNGIMLTGGRTSLDLDTTRNIRYVSNQKDYYNAKFLYNDPTHTSDGLDFQNLTKNNNDLNIFDLEINDIGYGQANGENSAFWVAVGQNVGLTDTIYYNNIAGTSIKNRVPTIEQFRQWKPATGDFNFSANGVTAGLSGTKNSWVAVGQNQEDFSDNITIKYSENGINWQNSSGASFTAYGNKVAFGISRSTYVAVGRQINNANSNILYSTNGGQNWNHCIGAQFEDGEGRDVVFGLSSNGVSVWVAVGMDTTNKKGPVKYSLDGINWQNSAHDFDFTKNIANAVIYNYKEKKFVVVGEGTSNYYTSPNGKDWTLNKDKNFNSYNDITSIAYNKVSGINEDQYNQIYYPPFNTQQFFIDKTENYHLRYFLTAVYLVIFIMTIIMIYTFYRIGNNSIVNASKNAVKKKNN